MKNSYKSIFIVLGLAVLLNACDGQGDSLINERLEDNPLPSAFESNAGSTDFSTYVAIGASFTAGYADGALYNLAQQNSFPSMVATSIGTTVDGGLTFQQPDINSEKGFNTNVGQAADTPNPLGRFKLDTNIPGPSPTIGGDPIGAYSGPQVHNFGVPGIQVGQLVTPLTGGPADPANPAFNPFYQRFASAPGISTILGDVVATQPSFFTLFIGGNDVLGYAVSGGSNDAILTDAATFQTAYGAVINTLMTSTSADGAVMDIPFFLGLPYFQAVPYNAIPVTDQASVDALNSAYAAYNGGLQAAVAGMLITAEEATRRTITFGLGANAFVMEDESLTDLSALGLPNYRQSEATDITLLAAASAFPTGVGTQTPAGDELVLTPEEQATIETSRQTFNGIIAAIVTDAAVLDRIALIQATPFANPIDPTSCTGGTFCDVFGFTDGAPGITIEGVNLAPDFSPNGIFSTDGIHLNPRGSAIFANDWINAIEAKFGATLPAVNVNNLPSVVVCGIGDCVSEQ
jgi:lysophospholipase L1-like esterase